MEEFITTNALAAILVLAHAIGWAFGRAARK